MEHCVFDSLIWWMPKSNRKLLQSQHLLTTWESFHNKNDL